MSNTARSAPRPEEPNAGQLATPGLLLRAVAVWFVLMGAETAHGVLRTLYLTPRVGDLRARQIGVFVGSALILIIARLAAPWLRARTGRAQLLVGGLWLALTLLFEVTLGLVVLGYSGERLASDYDISRGGLLPFGLVVLALAPWLAASSREVLMGSAKATDGPDVSGHVSLLGCPDVDYPRAEGATMIGAGRDRDRAAFPARLARPGPVLLLLVIVWVVYLTVLHPWLMNWGSTSEERAMALPGDTAPPSAYFTRAISIDAPPSAVWPWLLAIGQDRAGFYSNTWLENLTGADIHNADVLRPEWQQRTVGDRVPMAGFPLQRLGGEATLLTVRILEPERMIADLPGRFVLLPLEDGSTRLLLREPLAIPERAGVGWLIWDPMHFVMEQRMLRGIKERAEGQPLVPSVIQAAAQLGWALAGLALLAVFLARRRWWLWLLLPIGAAIPALSLTGDINSALAAFLAVGITIAGALAFGRRWWLPHLLLASAVALVLLLAPDPYAAFGLLFLAAGASLAGVARKGMRPFLAHDAPSAAPGRLSTPLQEV